MAKAKNVTISIAEPLFSKLITEISFLQVGGRIGLSDGFSSRSEFVCQVISAYVTRWWLSPADAVVLGDRRERLSIYLRDEVNAAWVEACDKGCAADRSQLIDTAFKAYFDRQSEIALNINARMKAARNLLTSEHLSSFEEIRGLYQ